MSPQVKVAIGMVVGALLNDLRKYAAWRKEHPDAKYSWVEAGINVAIALAAGGLAILGIPQQG
jgi:hypothetical protein